MNDENNLEAAEAELVEAEHELEKAQRDIEKAESDAAPLERRRYEHARDAHRRRERLRSAK